MSTKLKAGTATSGAVIDADTSGNLDLVSGSSSQYTASLPLATGTVMVSGNQPAFSAYANAYQTITQNVITKAVFQVEDFDTNNNFASSTFTPTVAGYYQINANITFEGTVSRNYNFQMYIYKNGALYNYNVVTQLFTGSTNNVTICTNSIISMNGSTDYVEIYVFAYDYTAGGNSSLRGSSGTRSTAFSGSLVRSA